MHVQAAVTDKTLFNFFFKIPTIQLLFNYMVINTIITNILEILWYNFVAISPTPNWSLQMISGKVFTNYFRALSLRSWHKRMCILGKISIHTSIIYTTVTKQAPQPVYSALSHYHKILPSWLARQSFWVQIYALLKGELMQYSMKSAPLILLENLISN